MRVMYKNEERSSEMSEVQPSKVWVPMPLRLDGSATDVSEEQPINAPLPKDVRLDGRVAVIDVSKEQSRKA